MLSHYLERLSQISDLAKEIGVSNLYESLLELAERLPCAPGESVAYMVYRLPTKVWNVEQNGDTVWIIIRNCIVTTILLRRSTQTCLNFNVDRALSLLKNSPKIGA